MNHRNLKLNPAARRRLDEYLDQVERLLMDSAVEREQRRSIVDDVEGQALEMLRSRTSQPDDSDVQAVIASLDPAEDYVRAAAGDTQQPAGQPAGRPEPQAAAPSATLPEAADGAGSPRFSRTAIIGALMLVPLLFFTPLALSGRMLLFTHAGSSGMMFPFGSLILLVPFLFLIPMCILGVVAISRIRHSEGRLYGMGLAVFDALLLPLLLLNGAVFSFLRMQPLHMGWPHYQALPFVRLGMLLACAALNCLIVWWVWRQVKKPPASTQPGGRFLQSNIRII